MIDMQRLTEEQKNTKREINSQKDSRKKLMRERCSIREKEEGQVESGMVKA